MATVFAHRVRKAQTPESAWRSEAIRWMKKSYGNRLYHHRNHQGLGSVPGVPDDFFLIRTTADGVEPVACVFVAIEFKEPNFKDRGKPIPRGIRALCKHNPAVLEQWDRRTEQDKQIELLRSCGARAAKVKNWEDLEKLLEGIEPVQSSIFGKRKEK